MQQARAVLERIWREFSGDAAWQTVADLSRLHRIQASPGYRQAAGMILERARVAGLQAELHSYPADERTSFWARPSFQEWECAAATLHLLEPCAQASLLCDFRAQPTSLVQRSTAFDGEVEVVLVENGEEEGDYEGLDVAGKVVLSSGDLRRVGELAVQARGAVGLLYDGLRAVPPVRTEGDLLDVRQYSSFWWQAGDAPCFGFVLTPRQGRMLRQCLKQGECPVRVRARVSSRLYDGSLEVVSAWIPGQGDEEVLVVSHLCHPLPSANDNASGAAAALEAARSLQALVSAGDLPGPRRTVRFLWVPEMTGTFAYLAGHEQDIGRMVAGINLDMVGEDQGQTGSSWLVESPPEAAASFAPELLSLLREKMVDLPGMPDVSRSHTGVGDIPLFRMAEAPFSGGSDHYILSDPTVGVPTPMLIQWPDRFYHTSADTPDRCDPRSLARTGALAAAYAYWLAAAGPTDVAGLGYEMVARFKEQLVATAQTAVTRAGTPRSAAERGSALEELDRRLAYRQGRQRQALGTLSRLGAGECLLADLQAEVARVALGELAWARGAIDLLGSGTGTSSPGEPGAERWGGDEAARLVPVRLVRGPVSLSEHLGRLSAEERESWRRLLKARKDEGASTRMALAQYWADGSRTVQEISDLVELETGHSDIELVLALFCLLEKVGLVGWQAPPGRRD